MKAVVRLSSIALSLTVCVATVSGAAVSARASDAARLCRSDALRLCYSEIPDRDLITACMRKKRAQLSPGCQAVFDDPAKPATIETASRQ